MMTDFKQLYKEILRKEQESGRKFGWFCPKCMIEDHIWHDTIKVDWHNRSMNYDYKVCTCKTKG